MARRYEDSVRPLARESSARAASQRAAPLRRVQAPAHPPRRAAEGEVGHGGEALLVGAQREQQVGDAVARRQRGVGHAHAPAVHAPAAAADEQRAGLARRARRPSRPRSSTSPVARVQLARVVADEVAEQPERRAPRRRPARRVRRGRTTFAPRCGVELGDDPRVRDAASATGSASGWSATSATPAARNGTTCARSSASTARPRARRRRRRRAGASGRAASSGRALAGRPSLAAGDRPAQDHEVGVDRQLLDVLGVARRPS